MGFLASPGLACRALSTVGMREAGTFGGDHPKPALQLEDVIGLFDGVDADGAMRCRARRLPFELHGGLVAVEPVEGCQVGEVKGTVCPRRRRLPSRGPPGWPQAPRGGVCLPPA